MSEEIQEEMIPYVICEANPDYKRPSIDHLYGKIEKNKLDSFLVDKLVKFVYERIDLDKLNSIKDIKQFWDDFYIDSYMCNSPWSAMAVINGGWKYVPANSAAPCLRPNNSQGPRRIPGFRLY